MEDGKLKQQASSDTVLAKTVSELVDKVGRPSEPDKVPEVLLNRALDVLTSQHRGGDDMERAFQIADRLKPQADPVQLQVMKTLAELVMERARPAEQTARPDPISQMKETAAFLKELGWGSHSSGSSGSWIDAVAALPGILQYGAQLIREMATMRAISAGTVIQMPAAPGAPPLPSSPSAIPTTTQPGGEMINPLNVNMLIEVGQDAIDAFERGISGDDFANGLVCRRGGEQLYNTLYEMGKESIISYVSMVPGLAEKLQPKRAELEAWLDEFIAYGTPEDGQGEGKSEETAGGKNKAA